MPWSLSDSQLFQAGGAILMVIGIILFVVSRKEARNVLKAPGIEIDLSTPSLVVFLTGAFLFAFPFTDYYKDRVSGNELHKASEEVESVEDISKNRSKDVGKPATENIIDKTAQRQEVDSSFPNNFDVINDQNLGQWSDTETAGASTRDKSASKVSLDQILPREDRKLWNIQFRHCEGASHIAPQVRSYVHQSMEFNVGFDGSGQVPKPIVRYYDLRDRAVAEAVSERLQSIFHIPFQALLNDGTHRERKFLFIETCQVES